MHSNKNYKNYHPNPFAERKESAVRGDCEPRYLAIKENMIISNTSSILDFGCAEGYVGFRFIQDGADSCHFVDNDTDCLEAIKTIASENEIISKVKTSVKIPNNRRFDVVLFLDLWSEKDTPSLKEFSEMTDCLFVSCSGNGSEKNMKLLADASNYFFEVSGIYTGYQGRTIFRCVNKHENSNTPT